MAGFSVVRRGFWGAHRTPPRSTPTAANLKTDFGGVGDGFHAALDTLAFQNAVTALPAGGVLFVPQGFWTLNAAITLSKPITIRGVGYGVSGANNGCQVVQTVDNTDAFVIASDFAAVEKLTVTTNVGSPTGGAAIHQTAGVQSAFIRLDEVAVSGFFNNVQLDRSQGAFLTRCVLISPVQYNFYLRNTVSADTGDSEMIGCYLSQSGTATGLRYESSGGLRTIGNKIIGGARGIDMQIPDGAVTGVFPVVGNSIENQTTNCVRIARSGTTGTFKWIAIGDNQINGTQVSGANDVVQLGAGISEVALTGNVIEGTASTTGVHVAANCAGVALTGNQIATHSVCVQHDGTLLTRAGNQYRNYTTKFAGTGSFADTDGIDTVVAAPTFAGTWSNFGAPYANAGYYLSGGRVYLRGVIKSTGADNTLFTLPAGFRPASSLFKRASSSSAGSEDVTVANTGVVSVGSGVAHSYLTLDGVDFLQEA